MRRLKTELFYSRNWQVTTIERFIEVVDSYIRWYNEKRIKLPWAHSVPSNIERASGLRHKSFQDLRRRSVSMTLLHMAELI